MTSLPGLLGRIVERTLADVNDRRRKVSRRELEERGARKAPGRRELEPALRRRTPEVPVRFICEIKKASPSKGILAPELDPGALAREYVAHGAAAISVVTEPHFFAGEAAFLETVRAVSGSLPVLRKDFHVHELQILEAAAGDADALLLLAAALAPEQLKDYLDIAAAFRLSHLVEVNDRKEAETALRAGARVIGINNRDLATFDVDVARTGAVLPVLREAGVVSVAESGIRDRDTVLALERLGVDALLVGEALVTAPDPGARLAELRGVDPDPS
jgi:indole-3-glycerol phosphate synthase